MKKHLMLAIATLSLSYCQPAHAEITEQVRVIDGDTFEIAKQSYRLVGVDTPETYRPRCTDELVLGSEATKFVRRMLKHSTAHIAPTGETDFYKRKLVQVNVLGTTLSQLLIEVGLGVPYVPPAKRPNWCSK